MKIIFVIDDLFSGGAQRQMVNLALEFSKLNHEITVLTYYDRDYYGNVLIKNNIEINCLNVKNPLKRIWIFRNYLRKSNADIVFSYLGVPNFICELAAIPDKSWKLVVNERSANPHILRSKKSKLIRAFHRFADEIVTNSQANKEIVLKVAPYLSNEKIKVIYNLIDLQLWSPVKNFEFKKSNVLKLVIAASHRYLKNFIGLLEAISLLNAEEKSKLKVSWYGNSLEEPFYDNSIVECLEFMKQKDLAHVVELYPATHQIKDKMAAADVIGLFSFFEGLPNVVCEGMALGKPILAANISDLPILVDHNRSGVLCDPSDSNSIAAGLKYFIHAPKDELKSMGNASRKKAEELFDREKILTEYITILQ